VNHQTAGQGQAKSTYTVAQFCEAHCIGRTHLYHLIKDGKGPRLMKLGRRILISAEAAADWRRQVESATAAEALGRSLVGELV
jgi:predicted DNA-binding transcriptional regulator AlpA